MSENANESANENANVNNNCPECGGDVWLAECMNTSGHTKELYVCKKCEWKAQPTEVWSRVTGYLRPVSGFNPGKKQEFHDRTTYKIEKEVAKTAEDIDETEKH